MKNSRLVVISLGLAAMIAASVLLVGLEIHDVLAPKPVLTATFNYYALLMPGESFSNHTVGKLQGPIEVLGWQVSISSFDLLHVQVWFWLDDENNHVFGYVNSGSSSAANLVVMFPANAKLIVSEGVSLHVGIWAHNMFPVKCDFHAKITIYYVA